ncbi:amidohydrolase family protein [Breznakiella homolactica]|uniref:Amidohydrolase family protein n=1 Tax=Breznakiella homolactica TaxID=2798577 RepID=A0A7T7XQW4_9SPIR|nr:amidohydrolase family protein [Breznakiella homolactica]QQO10777.1 amidohydrolase [Breznakiella homolactica]
MIDFHTHIIFVDGIKNKEKWDKIGKYFIYPNSKYPYGSKPIDEIQVRMNCGQIDQLVILPVDCERTKGEALLTNQEVKTLLGMNNNFIGFASVDPKKESALKDMEDAKAMGLVGLKLDPGLQGFSLDETLDHPMWRLVEQYRWPVVLHVGYSFTPDMSMYASTPKDVEALAIKYPKINFVMAHMAFPWVMEAALLAIKFPNIYMDTSMAYFDNPNAYAAFIHEKIISPSILEKSIREKIIFGSNYPRVRMESMKAAIEKWPVSDKAKRYLFNDNAQRLLNGAYGG